MAMYDVMIVGAGPAGLSAAVNCRVRNKSTVVVSRKFESPSLSKAPLIENYLGVDAMSGRELYQRLLEHARRSGAEFLEANVTGIYDMGDSYAALTSAGDVSAVAVILATGTVQSASIPVVSDKVGMGVSYCATCDGPLYKGKRVVVVGFSPHAVEEANFLSEICSEVTYVPASRGGSDVSHLKPAVNLAKGSVKAILGDMAVSGVELDSGIVETDGVFVIRESVPAEIQDRKKGPIIFDTDEHPIRGASMESVGRLGPAFKKGGVVTAANAYGINDGASAVVVMSKKKALELGIKPLLKMINITACGVDPKIMGVGPAEAIPKALKLAGLKFEDIEYWEINEAFAPQFLGVGIRLKEKHGITLDMEKCNHNGSGIALGHPVGNTALRIIVSLYYEMERLGLTLGGASLCVGTGPAMASLWTRDI